MAVGRQAPYTTDTADMKNEEVDQLVELNCQDMCSDSPNRMEKMAGSSSQD